MRATISPAGGATDVCWNAATSLFSNCSSSIRYKSDVRSFTRGLDVVRRLRPVTFDWNFNGLRDVGFVAEEIANIEPLLAIYNEKGEIEGVKYKQLTTVLVNAVNEQQGEMDSLRTDNENLRKEVVDLRDTIKAHREEIEALRALVCAGRRRAAVCRPARGH
jgi:hypothetical protein